MTFEMTGRHVTLTPAIRSHVEEKIRKLGRLVDDLEIHVTLTSEKHRNTCTMVAHGKKANYTGEVTNDDLFASINEAVDILARQLRKNKTSRLADRRDGSASIRFIDEDADGPSIANAASIDEP
ncbi:MAG: ribosome-associated translation inhibitor RaiA [Acidobacteriota bacterium]|nr:ribosome-associated translation inhibitor RaiA [Acidobacteriota bacterium]